MLIHIYIYYFILYLYHIYLFICLSVYLFIWQCNLIQGNKHYNIFMQKAEYSQQQIFQNLKKYLLQTHNIIILEQIGQGLTSKVYRICYSNNLSLIKCIKLYDFNKHNRNIQRLKYQFDMQCSVLQLLKIDNSDKVINMHMYGIFANFGYIVMEQIKQGSLVQFWYSLGNNNSRRCRQYDISGEQRNKIKNIIKIIMRQILNMLICLQHHHIIHHDLKLQNILINSQYQLKLIDFATIHLSTGTNNNIININTSNHNNGNKNDNNNKTLKQQYSCIQNEQQNKHRQRIKELDKILNSKNDYLVGSRNFICPQLISGNRKRVISPKIDIWAFAVIMFWLLTNRYPFNGQPTSNTHSLYRKIRQSQPFYAADIQQQQLQILKLCFNKDPTSRPSAKQLQFHKYFQAQENKNNIQLGKHLCNIIEQYKNMTKEQLQHIFMVKYRKQIVKQKQYYQQQQIKCLNLQQKVNHNEEQYRCNQYNKSDIKQKQTKQKYIHKHSYIYNQSKLSVKINKNQLKLLFVELQLSNQYDRPQKDHILNYNVCKDTIKISKQNSKQLKLVFKRQKHTIQLLIKFLDNDTLEQFVSILRTNLT